MIRLLQLASRRSSIALVIMLLASTNVRPQSNQESHQKLNADWQEKTSAGSRALAAGDYKTAESSLVAGLELAQQFGNSDPRLALSMNNLGALYLDQRKYGKARPLLQKAVVVYEGIYGAEHEEGAEAAYNLGMLHLNTNQPRKAQKYLHQVLEIKERLFGPDDLELVKVLTALAACARNELDEKEKYAYNALRILRESTPEQSLAGEAPFKLLASTYSSEIDRRSNRKIRSMQIVLLGKLCALHADYGDPIEGERLAREYLKVREKSMGRSSPSVANALGDLAKALARQERYEEAHYHLEQALQIIRQNDNIEPTATVWILSDLADIAEHRGDIESIKRLGREIVNIESAAYGKQHLFHFKALEQAADRLNRLGRSHEENEFARQLAALGQQPVEVGKEGVSPPILQKKVKVYCGGAAYLLRYETTILLSVDVNTEGKAENVHIRRCAGHGLDSNAVKAVRKWSFQPATKDGKMVATTASVEVDIRFR